MTLIPSVSRKKIHQSVEVERDEIIVTDCFVSITHSTHRSSVQIDMVHSNNHRYPRTSNGYTIKMNGYEMMFMYK